MFSDAMISLKVLGALIILLLLGAYSHLHGKIEDQEGLKIIRACVISTVVERVHPPPSSLLSSTLCFIVALLTTRCVSLC